MLKMMRNKNFVLIVIAIALSGFIATLFMSGQRGGGQQLSLGKIKNKTVTPQEYEKAWNNLRQNLYGNRELMPQERGMLPGATWDAIVYETLFMEAIDKMGLKASASAVVAYLRNNPHPAFQQSPYFQTNGRFDLAKYQQMIFTQSGFFDNPQNEYLIQQIENEATVQTIPNLMLQMLLMAGKTPSKSEVEYLYQSQNSKVVYEHASVHPGVERVELEDVTEEQINSYYNKNSDTYTSDVEQAALYIVRYSKLPDATDKEVISNYLLDLRDTLLADSTQSFADFAYESDDPQLSQRGGEIGWVPRGFSDQFQNNRMVYQAYKDMEEIAFSLKEGEVSTPFEMGPALSIITVDSVKMEGDSVTEVKVRQIVKNIVASEAKLDNLEAASKKLSLEATRGEFIKTAQALGQYVDSTDLYKRGELVPVIAYAEGLGSFVFDPANKAGDVSEVFENESAYYVVSIKSKVKSGLTPKSFVEKEIRRALADSLTVVNQMNVLTTSFASYDGSESLIDFAAKDSNLTASVTDTVTPSQYVPGIGANAVPTETALNTMLNKASKPVKGVLGVFVVRPLFQEVADFSKISDGDYVSLSQRIRSATLYNAQSYGSKSNSTRAFDEWHSAQKAAAHIKSNVAQYYY